MLLKKFSKVYMYIITAIIIITIYIIYFSSSIKQPYGNDKESIVQVIQSIEGYESESIEILEIKDIKDDRLVSFLSNNKPAYIHFSKNTKGNYKWISLERSADESFATFVINVLNDDVLRFMIVTNQENQVAKMHLGVNNQVIEQEFSVNQKSVYWLDLPETDDGSYSFTYKYFDKSDNLIFSSKDRS